MLDYKTGQHNRIGIALSGGTLKAAAHVGVLAGLEQLGITPYRIAGTSAGAFVASMYGHGYSTSELLDLIRQFPGSSLFDYGFPLVSSLINLWLYRRPLKCSSRPPHLPRGLLRGKKLEKYFRNRLTARHATVPCYVIATDLMSGEPVVYTNDEHGVQQGFAVPMEDVTRAVLGSCSIPGVFTPVQLKDRLLVDGAFRHYVPVKVLRQAGCNKIIAVNLYSLEDDWQPETFVHVLARSFDILLQESIDEDVNVPDIVVLKPEIKNLSWVSFHKMEACVDCGRAAVFKQEAAIRHLLSVPPTPPGQEVHRQHPRVRVSFHKKTALK